jgi:hypothetical protein
MVELLRRRGLVSKGAADVGEHLGRWQRVRPPRGIVEQLLQRLALMIVPHRGAPGPPEPRDAIGVRIVRGPIDQQEVVFVFR